MEIHESYHLLPELFRSARRIRRCHHVRFPYASNKNVAAEGERPRNRHIAHRLPRRYHRVMIDESEQLSALTPRSLDHIAAAAHVVQANVVALRVAWERRPAPHDIELDIRTPPPGPVRSMREALLDRETVKSYEPAEILLRLRQVWGEFCALAWLFPGVDPQAPINFGDLPPDQAIRCHTHTLTKLDEIQKNIWRIRHEQRRRGDREARRDPAFQKANEVALAFALRIGGVDVLKCSNEALFCAACEHVGMLAALRWASDQRWAWEAPGIMELALPAEGHVGRPDTP